jgi:putative flippase GtrA
MVIDEARSPACPGGAQGWDGEAEAAVPGMSPSSYSRTMPFAAALSRLRRAPRGARLGELAAFGVVGSVGFVIDVSVFQFLYVVVGLDAVVTKFLATTVSMTATFAGHRFWSFSRRARTGLRREYLRFTGINGITLLLGLAIVGFVRHPLGQEGALVLQAANVFSIGVGTVVRYLAYRKWVFPAPAPSAAASVGDQEEDPDAGARPAPSLS